MIRHYSYGIVPLQRRKEGDFVFFIKREKGFWECPKGHAENQETPLEAAIRELEEETGLKVTKLISEEPLKISYHFTLKGELVEKTVLYFVAEADGEIRLQESEVHEGKWVSLQEANQLAAYPTIKRLLAELSLMLM